MSLAQHPKYLVNVGVFSAIYIVVFLGTAAMGFFGPPMLFVGWIVGTIMNGVVITLYRLRTPVMGAMALLGFLEGVIAISRGYPWYTLIGATLLGFIADLINRAGGFQRRTNLMLGYAVFAPWIALPLVPVLINSEDYFNRLLEKAANKAYVAQLESFLTPTMVGVWVLILFVAGLVGGWLGNKLMDKHFKKAGMVA